MKLSILIPVYNERHTCRELIRRVLDAELPGDMSREVIVVDDGSDDGSRDILRALAPEHPDVVRYIEHETNRGKGAAIRTALANAQGDFCVIQDADLEYDPRDYGTLLGPLIDGQADAVFGSRFLPSTRRRVLYYWHAVGNRLLTTISNMLTGLNLTDMETGYKIFRTSILKSIPLRSNGFGIEPELTAKAAKRGLRIYEAPINYQGRTYQEGKKIGWRDGYRALATMLRFWAIDDLYDERQGHSVLQCMNKAHRFNRWMADAVVRPYLGQRVMEIGAGLGNLTLELLPRDRYIASEIDELHLDYLRKLASARPNLEVCPLDAEQPHHFERYRGEVDTIVALNVVEHLPRAQEALRNFCDVLAPGGRAIILVPQGKWLYSSLDRAVCHVKRYARDELARELRDAGFEIEELVDFNRIGVFGWLLNGKLLGRENMAAFQLKMFDSLVWLWRIVDRLLPWRGLSIVAVARKPVARAAAEPLRRAA